MSIEDIYPWIEFGYNEVKKNSRSIVRSFEACGYLESNQMESSNEMLIEESQIEEEIQNAIPIYDEEESQEENEENKSFEIEEHNEGNIYYEFEDDFENNIEFKNTEDFEIEEEINF